MHLTKHHEYGLRSMIFLASRSKPEAPQVVVQSREISQVEDISPKFLEHILLMLTKAGLLCSKIGAGGGYFLSRPANQITLGQVIRALDGRLEPIKCVSKSSRELCPCPREATCGVHMVMSDVYDSISNILDHTTLEDVSNRVTRTKEILSRNQDHENTATLLSQSVDFTI
jgi:Rrf2 family protein